MKRLKVFALMLAIALAVFVAVDAGSVNRWVGARTYVVTSDSGNDSTHAESTFALAPLDGATSLRYRIWAKKPVFDSDSTKTGLFYDDSVKLWLYSTFETTEILLDSIVQVGYPCSLRGIIPAFDTDGGSIGDTALLDHLRIRWAMWDSTSDTIVDVTHFVEYEILTK